MNRIVIIEDEESVLEVLHCNITRRGYIVDIARNGEDGYRKIVTILPDIIIMDIKLPDIDGWQILQRIKMDNITIGKVIVLSAAAQKSDREQAKKHNVSLFVAKPFDLPQLLSSIKNLMTSN